MTDRAALISALYEFKRATAKLADVWTRGDFDGTEMEGTYPDFLPDFAEAALAIADMEITIITTTQTCPVCDASDRGCDEAECRSM